MPQDESRQGLTYFHETIYSGLPVFLRRIDTALKNIGQPALPLDAKLFSFGAARLGVAVNEWHSALMWLLSGALRLPALSASAGLARLTDTHLTWGGTCRRLDGRRP